METVSFTKESVCPYSAVSGIGKSTLAAAFIKRGYRLLTDDVCAIKTFPDRKATVLPGFPHVKLTRDAAHKLGEDTEKLRREHDKEEKYILPVRDCHQGVPVSLNRVYILNVHNLHGCKLVKPDNIDIIKALQDHTYRKGMLKKMGETPRHFKMCGEITRYATVKMVLRPAAKFVLDELVDLLEEDFR